MFTQIIKTAKILIAKNQKKKLLQYFIQQLYGDKTPTQNEIQALNNKIQQIQQNSFNFSWFTNRFIQENKHYQDIDPLLDVQLAYKKLNKELRTFQFKDDNTFSDFNQFIESYLNKNVKNQEFQAPSYCKLIYSDSKYNYYYADAKDKQCYKDLHKCNTKKDGKQYAMWCVVTGSVTWGYYTTSSFPFYIYVTYKNNLPVMLFNFGYNNKAQIKDIHDDPFTKYDNELLTSIKYIANEYNFNITNNEMYNNFNSFNKIDKLYNKQIDIDSVNQSVISESSKYNGLNFIEDNIIYDFKKNQKAYLIANYRIINLQGYKITLPLLNLLKDKNYTNIIENLAQIQHVLMSCSQQVLNFMIYFFLNNIHSDAQIASLYNIISNSTIQDENKLKQIIQIMINKNSFYYLQLLIQKDKIQDENLVKQIIQNIIDHKQYQYIQILIQKDKIQDKNQMEQIIQLFIDNHKYDVICDLINKNQIKDENLVKQIFEILKANEKYDILSDFIQKNKIKDENLVKQIIQILIDINNLNCLCNLIGKGKIKDKNTVKQIIQLFINQNDQYSLYFLISKNKIKDEKQLTQSINFLINNRKYYRLSTLIQEDKIKDENTVKYIIQIFINQNKYDILTNLIDKDKIKDENTVKYIIQYMIENMIENTNWHNLYNLIQHGKIKDNNQQQYVVDLMIEYKSYDNLQSCIYYDAIKNGNKVKQIVQNMIDDKKIKNLSRLILENKIKPDKKQLKQITNLLIEQNQYYFLQQLFKQNKIKPDKKQLQFIQKHPRIHLSKILVKIAKIIYQTV